jgi:hypothetical protein
MSATRAAVTVRLLISQFGALVPHSLDALITRLDVLLEDLVLAKTGQPSRAEVTDTAAAQRAECETTRSDVHLVLSSRPPGGNAGRVG